MKKSVFIIGLGRFGKNLALNLIENDVDVIVADIDQKNVQEFATANGIQYAMTIDSTNFDALSASGVDNVNEVVVAMANIESSLLTCANLRDVGVKNLSAKAQNTTHSRLLKAIGVQNVIFPEKDSAIITAQQIIYDQISIIKQTKEITILSVVVKDDELVNKKCKDIENGEFKVFAIKPNQVNTDLVYNIDENSVIQKLDRLYIICQNNKLKNLKKVFRNNASATTPVQTSSKRRLKIKKQKK